MGAAATLAASSVDNDLENLSASEMDANGAFESGMFVLPLPILNN
jgi:hypothetical protein